MRAVVPGPAGAELAHVDEPVPGEGEVLIHVRAASLNRADLLRTSVPVLGLDAAGEVAALGPGVDGVAVGDPVTAKVAGGYAEYAKVDARLLLPIPDGVTFEVAAASVVGMTTEYHALALAGRLAPGEVVLVHGASSGVGLLAVQIARLLGAGRVFATTRAARADDLLGELGVDRTIHTSTEAFDEVVSAATDGRGADVIVDHVGGSYLPASVRALALGGRLVDVGRLGGATGELDLELLAFKRATIVGTTSRTRPLDEQIAIVDGVRRLLWPHLADGTLRVVVDRVLELAQVAEAHDLMRQDAPLGKIVLRVS